MNLVNLIYSITLHKHPWRRISSITSKIVHNASNSFIVRMKSYNGKKSLTFGMIISPTHSQLLQWLILGSIHLWRRRYQLQQKILLLQSFLSLISSFPPSISCSNSFCLNALLQHSVLCSFPWKGLIYSVVI